MKALKQTVRTISLDQISVADLTGVAIQDIQICKLVSKAIQLKYQL